MTGPAGIAAARLSMPGHFWPASLLVINPNVLGSAHCTSVAESLITVEKHYPPTRIQASEAFYFTVVSIFACVEALIGAIYMNSLLI